MYHGFPARPRRCTARVSLSALSVSLSFAFCLTSCAGAISGETGGVGGSAGGHAGSSGQGGGNHGVGGATGVGGGGGAPVGVGGSPFMALPSSLPAASPCVDNNPGPRLLRRLTAAQFAASIVDLFADSAAPVASVFNDPTVLGFTSDATGLVVQDLNADQLMTNAETVAAWAVSAHLSTITGGCTSSDATCSDKFIRAFGKRVFRAPVSESDVTAYKKIFSAESKFNDGVAAVVSAMLQAPGFLYRTEIGPMPASGSGATVLLTPYEVASSLSYLLTGSLPDATLLAAADQVAAGSSLSMSSMIDQQSQRLLGDARSQEAVMGFMTGWLGLQRLYTTVKSDTIFMLTDALRADMAAETRNLILEAFKSSGGMDDLLTADHSFLTKNLADFYGIPSTGLGTTPAKVTYTSSIKRDGGILANASILAGYARADISSPTQRGHLVRTRLLCQNIPDPPNNLDTMLHPALNAKTTRDHYLLEHSLLNSDPPTNCTMCHRQMDWIGFASEHYDAFGRWRDMENGVSIDASGKILNANATDLDVTVNGLSGPGGLETYLAGNDDLKHCMVRYWSYYAYGSSTWAQDACTYTAIEQGASASSYSLQSVLQGIVHAPHFTSRARN